MKTSPDRIARLRDAIRSPLFSHTRARPWCGVTIVSIYHRDPNSPTGVHGVDGDEESIVEPLLREARHAMPLSPTEPR